LKNSLKFPRDRPRTSNGTRTTVWKALFQSPQGLPRPV